MRVDWEYLFTGKPSAKGPRQQLPLSVTMANSSMRLSWKLSAGLIAIAFRIVAAMVRAFARAHQRDHNNW